VASSIWRRIVYDPVHGGWEFVNIGGRQVLDFIGQSAINQKSFEGIEFCCGSGATCRYLATNYDLLLTGVDINQKQIEFAHDLLKLDKSIKEDRIKFINADVLNWQPPRAFDFAFVMDSLMLLPDIPKAFANFRASLKDGGRVIIAEVAAGEAITGEARQLMWEFDGIINLPNANEYTALLEESGFDQISINDRTELGIQCFQTMSDSLNQFASEIINKEGEQGFNGWRQNTDFYLNGFKSGMCRYLVIEAFNRHQ